MDKENEVDVYLYPGQDYMRLGICVTGGVSQTPSGLAASNTLAFLIPGLHCWSHRSLEIPRDPARSRKIPRDQTSSGEWLQL